MKLSSAAASLSVLSTLAPAAVVAQEPSASTAGTRKLQIIHASDLESDFQDSNTLEEKVNHYSAITSGLYAMAADEGASSIHVTAGDNTLPGPFYQAAAEVESLGAKEGLGDAAIFNALGMTALGIGNHMFDAGADSFATVLSALSMPALSVNLDFSNFAPSPPVAVSDPGQDCSSIAGTVSKSCVATLPDGLRVGLVGRAPADFFNVVAADAVSGLDFVGGRDPETNQPLQPATPMVQEQVDALAAAGIDVVMLLDHAQDFTSDPLSAAALRGVDVIVQAGGTEFMVGSESEMMFNTLREGDSALATKEYPVVRTDADGNMVLVVEGPQLYRYVCHLLVEFDENGHIAGFDDRSGLIPATEESVEMFSDYLELDTPLAPIPGVADTLAALQGTESIVNAYTSVGSTAHVLEGARENVRTRETSLSRVVSDSSIWGAQALFDDGTNVDIALKNGGGIRATILGPEITRIAIQSALAFDNKLAVVRVTLPQLIAIFENALSRYPAADGRFPHVAGMNLHFDPDAVGVESMSSLDDPSRIVNLVVGDMPVVENGIVVAESDKTFVIATNNFLLTGGDGYAAFLDAELLAETEMGEQQILEDYIKEELGSSVDVADPPSEPRVMEESKEKDTTTGATAPATEATEAAATTEATEPASDAADSVETKEQGSDATHAVETLAFLVGSTLAMALV